MLALLGSTDGMFALLGSTDGFEPVGFKQKVREGE
jgi:hypothetical protein